MKKKKSVTQFFRLEQTCRENRTSPLISLQGKQKILTSTGCGLKKYFKNVRILERVKKKEGELSLKIYFLKPFPIKPNFCFASLKHIFFSLMVKFDEVRTGGNMMPTATLAVGTTEGKISGKCMLKVKVMTPIAEQLELFASEQLFSVKGRWPTRQK